MKNKLTELLFIILSTYNLLFFTIFIYFIPVQRVKQGNQLRKGLSWLSLFPSNGARTQTAAHAHALTQLRE